MQKVLVLDFGAQYGQLIARRIRDLGVYSEIVPCSITAEEIKEKAPSAIVLSGGPASVYDKGAPSIDPNIFNLKLPILGFCYGHQIIAKTLGGQVSHSDVGEYGPATITVNDDAKLFANTPKTQQVWMSHRDSVTAVPKGFSITSTTDVCEVASMEDDTRKIFSTQFHPEVKHTEFGQEILSNFLFNICNLEKSWQIDSLADTLITNICEQVGDSRVILGLSGGVDSSVVAALLSRAIGKKLICVFVNHGFMRKDEPEEVEAIFSSQFDCDFIHVHAEDRYLKLLEGISDPEKKRSAIGTQFWKEFFEVAQNYDGIKYLAQGTIYPDIIESGSRKSGEKSSKIKSHHNLIPFPEGVHFDLIEPLDHFFKDEVRELGVSLGLPSELVYRQPFPGPGLAIRIIGDVTQEKLDILKCADKIVRQEIDVYNEDLFKKTNDRNSQHSAWQYFAVLPDIRSVGVMGDERTYARPIILRAVESSDAMTSDWAKLPYELLTKISSRIVAEVAGVNRVCYDITSKPPATIEWE